MLNGLIDLPWWGYIVVTLALTHITIAAVTIFLHRHQAHRALDLHPIVSHFFRFWLWLTTGMETKEWAAVHRKHHARCETPEDPHSPQVLGLRKVFWEGAELYKVESKNAETLERFGQGTPDDWIEHHLYAKHSVWGIAIMLIVDVVLFGPIGISMWGVQMLWIPVFAAGVVNGVGHYWGYRNFECDDAARNIVPWGILIGGEELHNNHHSYPTSARLSNKWYEFDIGWLYIRVMETVGLARVKKKAPQVRFNTMKTECDAETLQAVITHRYDVLAKYAKSLRRTCTEELVKLKQRASNSSLDLYAMKRWLHSDAKDLEAKERAEFDEALRHSKVLSTVYAMRQDLSALWQRSTASKEQLVSHLQDWCRRAEASGIAPLQEFSRKLRCYT
ncbi:MAG: DesA family fatty acid desaturase [Burkholderiales bacterium]|nr:fatty acid desaturase [Burkholderiales bacterium]MDQ3196563.1 fatty acid desaturase [Pseudomonadota bacterium]